MTTAVPKITIRRESDFVDVVPIMLGFVPDESLVAIFLQPATSTAYSVRLVARMDLPTSEADLAQAVTVLTTHGAGNPVVLVAYSTDLDSGVQVMENSTALGPRAMFWPRSPSTATTDTSSTIKDTHSWSPDPKQTGSPPKQSSPEYLSRFQAGRLWPTRSPDLPFEVAEDTDHAIASIRTVGGCLDGVGMISWLTERSRDGWPLPSRDELITLIASVQEIDVRDAAWLSISRADAHQHLVLWRQAAALVDGPAALPVLGLLGMAAWIDSQGALANLVLDRARTTEGFADYTMFGLLEEILGRGMDPACWESLQTHSRRAPDGTAMTSREFTIQCGPGVADALLQADQMIRDARSWVGSADCQRAFADVQHPPSWTELDVRVQDMELSLLRCLRLLINLAAGTGEVRLTRDSDVSLLFHQPATGLTGGMIYHPDKVDEHPDPDRNLDAALLRSDEPPAGFASVWPSVRHITISPKPGVLLHTRENPGHGSFRRFGPNTKERMRILLVPTVCSSRRTSSTRLRVGICERVHLRDLHTVIYCRPPAVSAGNASARHVLLGA